MLLLIWPLENERARALAWLRMAEEGGGSLGMQGLVYTLALDPDALRARGAALRALLSAPGAEGLQQRLRACDCLLALDAHNAATRRFAAELWRVLAAERSAGLHALPATRLSQLLKRSADAVLAEDLPRTNWSDAPAPTPLNQRAETLHLRFAEQGLFALEEVRVLPDGGHLLALGEGGVALARQGRAPLRFPVPAHHLVVSDNGRRALALAKRENAMRVSRIDLVSGKVDDWFSANLSYWADEYDGAAWSVVADERLMVLDTSAPGRSVLWQVGDLPGKILGFQQHGQHQALVLGQQWSVEQWRYQLPARRLLARTRVDLPENPFAVLADCSCDAPLMIAHAHGEEGAQRMTILAREGRREVHITLPDARPRVGAVYDGMLVMPYDRPRADGGRDFQCQLLNAQRHVVADLVLPDAARARAIVHAGHLLAWDQHGRVIDVELATAAARMLTF